MERLIQSSQYHNIMVLEFLVTSRDEAKHKAKAWGTTADYFPAETLSRSREVSKCLGINISRGELHMTKDAGQLPTQLDSGLGQLLKKWKILHHVRKTSKQNFSLVFTVIFYTMSACNKKKIIRYVKEATHR